MPEYTGDITGLGTTRLLEALRHSGVKAKFYQASSSEMFGRTPPPQNERSPFCPQSPYAAAKLYAYWMTLNYRDAYQLHAVNGILFNHESPRRNSTFVTRKITRGIAQILAGQQDKIYLGNLKAQRDWGFAPEYVACQWRILQEDKPEDYVIGTGQSHTVQEFAEEAFAYANLDWRDHVELDPRYLRPLETEQLQADISKAKQRLEWEPQITFHELIRIMVDADLKALGLEAPNESETILRENGFEWTNLSLTVE